jgi:hypothetical protein
MNIKERKRVFHALHAEFNIEYDFEATRLVTAVRGNKTYHYWRKTCNITRAGLYTIRIKNEHYILKNGKLIELWDEILDAIELEKINSLRDKKLNKVLNEVSR